MSRCNVENNRLRQRQLKCDERRLEIYAAEKNKHLQRDELNASAPRNVGR